MTETTGASSASGASVNIFSHIARKARNIKPRNKLIIGVGAAAAVLLYLFVTRRKTAPADGATVYYPEYQFGEAGASSYIGGGSSGGSGGSSGGVGSGGGGSGTYTPPKETPAPVIITEQDVERIVNDSTQSAFSSFANQIISKLGDSGDITTPAGVPSSPSSVDFNAQVRVNEYTEGRHTYKQELTATGEQTIYKNGEVVPEENYKYIPSRAGGTRDDQPAVAVTVKPQSKPSAGFSSADYELQQAQLAYGAALASNDRAGMAAAAAKGQELRAKGATDAGAAKAWQSFGGNN